MHHLTNDFLEFQLINISNCTWVAIYFILNIWNKKLKKITINTNLKLASSSQSSFDNSDKFSGDEFLPYF